MTASSPAQVLGTIGAMETLVENFPMSILDIMNGPTYTSVFMFLMDVLKMCGISFDRLAEYLIEEIFGYDTKLNLSPKSIYDSLGSLQYDEQSNFLSGLENSVKGIIMAILSSLFSCSAVPLLPNAYFDRGKDAEWFNENYAERCEIAGDGKGMYIPSSLIDYFGYLNVSPFSKAGKMFFDVEGGDKYYRKVQTSYLTEPPSDPVIQVPQCEKYVQAYIVLGPGHENWVNGASTTDEYLIKITDSIDVDLNFIISYIDTGGNSKLSTLTIKKGETESDAFFFAPTTETEIFSVLINSHEDGITIDNGEVYIYLDAYLSSDAINYWTSIGNESPNNIRWCTEADGPKEEVNILSDISSTAVYTDRYIYVENNGPIEGAKRVSSVPLVVTKDSADVIVCYDGLTPSTLYKTEDLNAFLWYIFNQSGNNPQAEVNKNMWDSRYSERLESSDLMPSRQTPEDWSNWYNYKDGTTEREFPATDTLYPILQFGEYDSELYVKFPAQTYFKPTIKGGASTATQLITPNATLYQFNWEYLQNIRIFHPRAILFGMIDALLNGALTYAAGIKVSVSMAETSTILSNAIKKYIEAEDAEVSDCYASFSNEEFDAMLEDMMLSRYGATKYGGEVNRAQTHDLESYLDNLNAVNLSSSMEGETTKIKRIITDVATTDKEEGSIDFGVNFNFGENLWQQLIWAIALPIIKSILTPQVILLFLINFQIMGLINLTDIGTIDGMAIIRLVFRKIFALVRTIISFIKDKIAELIWRLIEKELLPLLLKYHLLVIKEQIDGWLELLVAVLLCLPRFRLDKPTASIDDVDYADITDEQTTPESTTEC